jgi:methionyl aminopeptidase
MSSVRRARASIVLKSPREIELMRQSGGLVCQVLDQVAELVKPGVTTRMLNQRAEELIADAGADALFKGVEHPQAKFPFPAALCTSVNDEIVHGIPNDRPLAEGDIVGVDCGVKLAGYCGDSARTFAVGRISAEVQRLLDVTAETLLLAIDLIKPGRMWGEVAGRMQKQVEDVGFSVVREFVGHGIGQQMHEEPKLPNYHDRRLEKTDFRLEPGMTLAVEPMVNIGTAGVRYSGSDGWVVATKDGKWSAHFEHTVAVTDSGARILTLPLD